MARICKAAWTDFDLLGYCTCVYKMYDTYYVMMLVMCALKLMFGIVAHPLITQSLQYDYTGKLS